MLFRKFGNPEAPVVVLLHGGGLSWWSLQPVIDLLAPAYCIVTPVIDGFGEDAHEPFQSIEASAQTLLKYIRANHGGRVYALGGLSLGAQIVVEALSMQPNAADYAVIESALVIPIRATKALTVPIMRMSYWLIRQRWFARLQARELCLPEAMFERYYTDSVKLSKASMIRTILSNGTYALKNGLAATTTKALIIVGEKEIAIQKKPARALCKAIANSTLYTAPAMKHGELSLLHPKAYVDLLQALFHDSPLMQPNRR